MYNYEKRNYFICYRYLSDSLYPTQFSGKLLLFPWEGFGEVPLEFLAYLLSANSSLLCNLFSLEPLKKYKKYLKAIS